MNQLELLVGGKRYGGWTEVEVTRSIEALSNEFRVEYTDRWDGQVTPIAIEGGSAVTVLMDGETVITGYTDYDEVAYDQDSHTLVVQGRDKAGDLIDSSAVHGSGQWLNADLMHIAKELLNPFGMSIQADADVGEKFKTFALQPGETVHEALDRLTRMRGVLPVSDGKGGLRLTRAGTEVGDPLVEGENIKSARATNDMKGRHSKIICRGQIQALDDFDATDAFDLEATASDPGIKRHRPLIVHVEDEGHSDSMTARAEWECRRRVAKGLSVVVTVQGWRGPSGKLWTPNVNYPIRSPFLRLDTVLLCKSVRYAQNDREGTIAEITLVDPAAFDPTGKTKKRKVEKYAPL